MRTSMMQVALTALMSTAPIDALTVRNKHVADFRLFGDEGCSKQNQGIWTVIDDDFANGECKSLQGNPARSILAVDVNPGCTLSFYPDEACTAANKRDCPQGECCNAAQDWKAWSMVCS